MCFFLVQQYNYSLKISFGLSLQMKKKNCDPPMTGVILVLLRETSLCVCVCLCACMFVFLSVQKQNSAQFQFFLLSIFLHGIPRFLHFYPRSFSFGQAGMIKMVANCKF